MKLRHPYLCHTIIPSKLCPHIGHAYWATRRCPRGAPQGSWTPRTLEVRLRDNSLISACRHNQVNVTEAAVGVAPSAVYKEMVKSCPV